jgi:hypothetical protein
MELWIGRNKSPITYLKICQHKIEQTHGKVMANLTLIALEGAIIHAVDTANLLIRSNAMEIMKIETDYVEVKGSLVNQSIIS